VKKKASHLSPWATDVEERFEKVVVEE